MRDWKIDNRKKARGWRRPKSKSWSRCRLDANAFLGRRRFGRQLPCAQYLQQNLVSLPPGWRVSFDLCIKPGLQSGVFESGQVGVETVLVSQAYYHFENLH